MYPKMLGFSSLAGSPFYKRPPKIVTEVSANGTADNVILIPDIELAELINTTEPLQTQDGMKMLNVYRGYLLWFQVVEHKPNIAEPEPLWHDLHGSILQEQQPQIAMDKDMIPILNGIAKIRGFTLESNSTIDTYISEMSRTTVQPPNVFTGVNKLNREALSFAGFGSRTGTGSISNKTNSTRSTLFFKLSRSKTGSAHEVLIFGNQAQQDKWRANLAKVPVFFSDFSARYRLLEHLSKDKKFRILLIKDMQTHENCIAKVQKIDNMNDRNEVVKTKLKILNESKILLRLKNSGFTAKFRELCYTQDSFIIVEEALDTIPFHNWFKEWWCVDVCNPQNQAPVYLLMLDLAKIVLCLANSDVAHCSFTKSHLLLLNNKSFDRSAVSAVARDTPPNISQPKRMDTVKISNPISVKVIKPDIDTPGTPKILRGLLDSGLEGPPSTMNVSGQRKIYVTGFASAVDLKQSQRKSGLNQSFRSLLPDQDFSEHGMEWEYKHLVALSIDVYNLGLIFYEM